MAEERQQYQRELGMIKDAEEFREFFKNLGIEYRFLCYHEKNFEGCHLLAEFFDNIERDYPKSSVVYKMNCDQNKYGRSCYNYAKMAFHGKAVPKSPETTYEYMAKSCEYGHPPGCHKAGHMIIGCDKKLAKKIPPDATQAMKHLEKGCELGHAEACNMAGSVVLGGKFGQQVDMPRAFKLFSASCEMNNPVACHNISLMYQNGHGVERNEDLSLQFRRKAKDLIEDYEKARTLEFEQYTSVG